MKRRDVLPTAMLMATSAFLGAAVYYSAPAEAAPDQAVINYAKASAPAVCTTLDSYPSFPGIVGVAKAITEDGFTAYEAGEVIYLSVAAVCPRHLTLLDRFIAANAPSSPATAGKKVV